MGGGNLLHLSVESLKVQRLPLNVLTIIIESPRVYTAQGVPIDVTGVAQVRMSTALFIHSVAMFCYGYG